jgi:hypothetical protein
MNRAGAMVSFTAVVFWGNTLYPILMVSVDQIMDLNVLIVELVQLLQKNQRSVSKKILQQK